MEPSSPTVDACRRARIVLEAILHLLVQTRFEGVHLLAVATSRFVQFAWVLDYVLPNDRLYKYTQVSEFPFGDGVGGSFLALVRCDLHYQKRQADGMAPE